VGSVGRGHSRWREELRESAARLRTSAEPYREGSPHEIPRSAAVFRAAETLEWVAESLEQPAVAADREAVRALSQS
jgi:hypothetical protein